MGFVFSCRWSFSSFSLANRELARSRSDCACRDSLILALLDQRADTGTSSSEVFLLWLTSWAGNEAAVRSFASFSVSEPKLPIACRECLILALLNERFNAGISSVEALLPRRFLRLTSRGNTESAVLRRSIWLISRGRRGDVADTKLLRDDALLRDASSMTFRSDPCDPWRRKAARPPPPSRREFLVASSTAGEKPRSGSRECKDSLSLSLPVRVGIAVVVECIAAAS